ncbi:MAG: YaiO family outer membrane beta-barrel protein [Panacibacter sp.]
MKNRLLLFLIILASNAVGVNAQKKDSIPNTITLTGDYFHFDKQFDKDWKIAGIEYKRQASFGAILGRVNYANRFGKNGLQFEAEAYPVFSKKVYSYVALGYSGDGPVFPKIRAGYSIYVSIKGGWEPEMGFRYLYFDKNVWVGTLGISKYAGNWLLNAKAYLSGKASAVNQSYFFTARKYFHNEIDYAWMQIGTGVSPDEIRNIQINTSTKLTGERIAAGIRKTFLHRNQAIFTIGWAQDEYLPGVYGNQFFGTIGYARKF